MSIDNLEIIIKLITDYPEFKKLYEEVYEMCLNMERMMEMFSKELLKLDKNTVQYMIDEMQDKIDELMVKNTEKEDALAAKDNALAAKDNVLAAKEDLISQQNSLLTKQRQEIEMLKQALSQKQK